MEPHGLAAGQRRECSIQLAGWGSRAGIAAEDEGACWIGFQGVGTHQWEQCASKDAVLSAGLGLCGKANFAGVACMSLKLAIPDLRRLPSASHLSLLPPLFRQVTLERVGNRTNAGDMESQWFYKWLQATWPWHVVGQFAALYIFGGFPAVVWGGALRMVWVYHVTWFVNSASHVWGDQTYNTGDLSRNNWWVSVPRGRGQGQGQGQGQGTGGLGGAQHPGGRVEEGRPSCEEPGTA